MNEVVNVYDGVHQTPDYKDSGVMFLSVENISTLKSEKYISEEAFQRDYKVYPQKGDILMTRIGDVGTPNVVEATEKVAFYVSLALLKPTKINSYFLCNSIQSPLFQKGLKDRTLVTAIPQKINKDEIGKVNIILPTSSQEQQLIGDYFRNLDNLITLHQRKCDQLGNIKKALLEKMFPSQNEYTPRIRFKCFTDAWEQRKLNEIVSYASSSLSAKDAADDGKWNLYDANHLIGKTNLFFVRYDYITIIKDGAGVGRVRLLPKNSAFIGTMGALLPLNSDLLFDYALLTKADLSRKFSGSTIPHIYFKDYGNETYRTPLLLEQQKIGSLFERLDSLITLHQRKCEKLKNIKKSLLEKMFA